MNKGEQKNQKALTAQEVRENKNKSHENAPPRSRMRVSSSQKISQQNNRIILFSPQMQSKTNSLFV
jgi:hypothetical protein